MKATDEMKMYLNSVINKIDADIHNELWDKLITIITENEQLKNCNLQNVSNRRELLKAYEQANNPCDCDSCKETANERIEKYLSL